MNKFNLERALTGEKVITRDGREVTQLTNFNVDAMYMRLTGVVGRELRYWHVDGINPTTTTDDSKLFMAPKKLSGFVNVYRNGEGDVYLGSIRNTEEECRLDIRQATHKVLLHLDLSQFDEGHGL